MCEYQISQTFEKGENLIATSRKTTSGSKTGDLFEAKARKNVAEKSKPTAAQKKARSKTIKKAQSAKSRNK